jgi:hypothetical protein
MSLRPPVAALAALAIAAAACSSGTSRAGGGPPPGFRSRDLIDVLEADRIPPIERPRFVETAEAKRWLRDREPVVTIDVNDRARAYPLQILLWHEVVNDSVGGRPILVTYSPLTDAAVVYDRTVRSRALVFGTSGKLYRSDLVLYDRRTESLWLQLTGVAALGALARERLRPIPSAVVSFADFRAAHPAGEVLSPETGFSRPYGTTPLDRYDTTGPFKSLLPRPPDGRLRALERVVGVSGGERARAYPFARLAALAAGGLAAVADSLEGEDIVVVWKAGTASVLDSRRTGAGRDVGAAVVLSPVVAGRILHFDARGGRLVDRETGSTWNLAGRATSGRLAGKALAPVLHVSAFWFAWSAFHPASEVWRG